MQLQRLLGRLHKLGNLGIDSNRQAAFGQHDLGGCLHELLGRTNRASWIVWQCAPDSLQLGADPRWVGETGQSCLKCGWALPTDPAALWDSNTRSARSTCATSVQSTPAA